MTEVTVLADAEIKRKPRAASCAVFWGGNVSLRERFSGVKLRRFQSAQKNLDFNGYPLTSTLENEITTLPDAGWPKEIAGSNTVKISERSNSFRISCVSSPEMMR